MLSAVIGQFQEIWILNRKDLLEIKLNLKFIRLKDLFNALFVVTFPFLRKKSNLYFTKGIRPNSCEQAIDSKVDRNGRVRCPQHHTGPTLHPLCHPPLSQVWTRNRSFWRFRWFGAKNCFFFLKNVPKLSRRVRDVKKLPCSIRNVKILPRRVRNVRKLRHRVRNIKKLPCRARNVKELPLRVRIVKKQPRRVTPSS